MRILSLELENIKSYRRALIDFIPGLNAVCGANGSGKTTILEAIGFTLFDYLPYSQSAFVREGEKSGTVRVRILAGDDREYEVVRRAGAASTYYVADVETGTRLVERVESVIDWIATHALGIEGRTDLKAFFKDAVGVPQGSMTAHFLQSGIQRKSVFDPLLRVEEYRQAYEGLRDAVSYLRELMARIKEEIAGLEARTLEIPLKQEERSTVLENLRQIEARLTVLSRDLNDVESRRASLDQLEQRQQELQILLTRCQGESAGCLSARAEREREAISARTARQVVTQSQEGYRLVMTARERMKSLETQRRERDDLRTKLTGVQQDYRGVFGGIEKLDEQIRSATDAAQKAAALIDQVASQAELDAKLKESSEKLREARTLLQKMQSQQEAIAARTSRIQQRQGRIEEARAAAVEAKRWGELEREYRDASDRLASLLPLRDQLQRAKTEGVQLRARFDALQRDEAEHQTILAAIEDPQKTAGELDDLLERDRALRIERAQVATTIEYQSVAREDLTRSHCPILELRCPVVAVDSSALERFEGRVTQLRVQASEVESELAEVSSRLIEARAAAATLHELRVRAAKLEQSGAQLEAIQHDLEQCRSVYEGLARELTGEEPLRVKQAELSTEIDRLRPALERASALPHLEEAQSHDTDELEAWQRELAQLEEQSQALQGIEGVVHELEARLATLDDPRRRQQDLLAQSATKAEVERTLAREHERLADAGAQVKAISANLLVYERLEPEIQEQSALEAQHMPAYERYLSHRDESSQLEEREMSLTAATVALHQAEAAESEVAREHALIQQEYDAALHQELKERHGALKETLAQERTNRSHAQAALERVERDLALLRKKEEELRRCQDQLREMEGTLEAISFIRHTINSAGPVVTETLLANISRMASDIYAEIMDDHAAELRWERDYDVLVQRGAEARRFAQLSGGEQMSAAMAVRLALLRELSEADFAFFDEPTQNMDDDRRTNLAGQISALRGFEQLIVISHDDTFEHHTDNLIRLRKSYEETEVQAS